MPALEEPSFWKKGATPAANADTQEVRESKKKRGSGRGAADSQGQSEVHGIGFDQK